MKKPDYILIELNNGAIYSVTGEIKDKIKQRIAEGWYHVVDLKNRTVNKTFYPKPQELIDL